MNTARMRKRAEAAAPVARLTWDGHRLFERRGWEYIGEPGAAMVIFKLEPKVGLQFAMPRYVFDAMSDDEFADRMGCELAKWTAR